MREKERDREKKRAKKRKEGKQGEKREKEREKDVQGQLLSICTQFKKEKLNILAEMLKILKSGCELFIYI